MAEFLQSRIIAVLLLASLVIAVSAAPPKPSSWQLCDKHAAYDISVKNVTINPDPVISGEDATFIVPAYTEKEITSGSVIVSVSFHGVTVHVEKDDICNKAHCPISPGEFVLENTEVLPGLTPPGSYKIKLQFLDDDNKQLACADINFSIIWSRSMGKSLESFNPIGLHGKITGRHAVAHT